MPWVFGPERMAVLTALVGAADDVVSRQGCGTEADAVMSDDKASDPEVGSLSLAAASV